MKKLFTFFVLFCALAVVIGCHSGSGSGSESKSEPVEDSMNEKSQDMFFGTKFGASREEVIRNFAKHGFDVNKSLSTENWVYFFPVDTTTIYRKRKDYYSFGGHNWKLLSVSLNNDKFYLIRFANSFNDKASALNEYQGLLSTISKKYHVSEAEPIDTTVYKVHVGYDKQNRYVGVSCYRDESIGGELYYYVELLYRDDSIAYEPSDEL